MSWKTIDLIQGLGDRIGQAGGQVLSGMRYAQQRAAQKKREEEEQNRYDTQLYLQHPELVPGEGDIAKRGRAKVGPTRVINQKEWAVDNTPGGKGWYNPVHGGPRPGSQEATNPRDFRGPPTPTYQNIHRVAYNPKTRVGGEATAGITPQQIQAKAAGQQQLLDQLNIAHPEVERRDRGEARQKSLDDYRRSADILDRTLRESHFNTQSTAARQAMEERVRAGYRNLYLKLSQLAATGEPGTPGVPSQDELDYYRQQAGIEIPTAGPAQGPQGPSPDEIAGAQQNPQSAIDQAIQMAAEAGAPFEQAITSLGKLGIQLPPDVAQRAQQQYQVLVSQQRSNASAQAERLRQAVEGYRIPYQPPTSLGVPTGVRRGQF